MEFIFSRIFGNDQPESKINIMLLGSTGSGKSASGNTILSRARNPFKEDFSPEAVTRFCQSEQTELDGQTITVIDTVGLSDTEVTITDAQTQIEKMITILVTVDVFLLVIKLGETFRKNDIKVVNWIRENFGAKALLHSVVLFTHGDQLHAPVEGYLSKCKTLRSVIGQCSGGFHVFNNKIEDRFQVTELLKEINKLRRKNRYSRYTEQDYKKTQKSLLRLRCVTVVFFGALLGFIVGTVAGELIRVTAEIMALIGKAEFTAQQATFVGGAGCAVLGAAAGVYLLSKKCFNLMTTMGTLF